MKSSSDAPTLFTARPERWRMAHEVSDDEGEKREVRFINGRAYYGDEIPEDADEDDESE